MRRRGVAALFAAPLLLAVAVPSVARAEPTSEVIQGDVLRLVSIADWDSAGGLLPGQPVQWDVEVSADAEEPGRIRIGVRATGDARLRVDIALCSEPWGASGCASGSTVVRDDWSIPRDGAEVPVTEIAHSETAHLRLAIALDPADGAGTTEVQVVAHGAGETVLAGPGGGLATTGPSPGIAPLIVAAGLVVVGGAALGAGRRRSGGGEVPR
ncbi:hypothetical protein SAMN04489809_1275 [Microbacterium paraoxydans]|uniref:LPXTG-motif cell wall anchor domain-containing protein n=1 Tax=Microbacterium paraoxydans TaxID=199592 RepID=A0A1H1Q4F0_9MICO|nr:hypothetical protein SAMN04489809_1275 [Microbacterium paraoxydans]